ncbi:MAG: hypothetical protein L0Z46_11305 [Nitrospiraceae bacterium]|nr:hypothetical protein [Nitrospiraceae bacterium]
MALRVTIEAVEPLSDGVWMAKLPPSDAGIFGPCSSRSGDWTVVVLDETPEYDPARRILSVEPRQARLLNVGASDQLMMLGPTPTATTGQRSASSTNTVPGPSGHPYTIGDQRFLEALTRELAPLGRQLLAEVRRNFRGELKFYPNSGRFVETPDNFWTVKVQPRDQSLLVTVRGLPESFGTPRTVQLGKERSRYSRFKVARPDQLPDAVSVIRKAATTRHRGSGRP